MEGLTVLAGVLTLAARPLWPPEEEVEWYGRGDLILAVAIVAVLLVAAVVFHVLVQRRARERVLQERREIFRRMVRDCDLLPGHIEVLKHLVTQAASTRPHLVVTSLNFYDSCVDRELARLEEEGHPFEARQHFANLCIEARERLFFGERGGGRPLETTRDLLPNQKLRLEFAGHPGTFTASVIQASESSLTITMPTDEAGRPAPLERGQDLVCYLTARSDAIYSFATGVAGIRGGHLAAVHLWHTDKLDRRQLRSSVRMSVDLPVRFHRLQIEGLPPAGDQTPPPPEPEFLQSARHVGLFQGMMRDFSLGGLCMRCEAAFGKGEHLGILVPTFDAPGERSGEMEIAGRVVDVIEVDSLRGRAWNVHVQFVGLGEEDQARLMVNMFRLQRHLGHRSRPEA